MLRPGNRPRLKPFSSKPRKFRRTLRRITTTLFCCTVRAALKKPAPGPKTFWTNNDACQAISAAASVHGSAKHTLCSFDCGSESSFTSAYFRDGQGEIYYQNFTSLAQATHYSLTRID